MAYKTQALVSLILLSLLTFSSSQPNNGLLGVYWGQGHREDDLKTTCDTGKYEIVLLAYLIVFGDGQEPFLYLYNHCYNHDCTGLEPQIKHCQAKGIKVFLSLGGPFWEMYSLNSTNDAKEVAKYLHTNFLTGKHGPLGSVYLDGIEFNIRWTKDHWDDLVKELHFLRHTKGPHFLLSAAPLCHIPVLFLDKAIQTQLFDHIFVRFYDDESCEYNILTNDTQPLLESWDNWVNLVPFGSNNSLFLGLPAAITASGTGFAPATVVNNQLPGLEVIGYVGVDCGIGFNAGITFYGIVVGLPANFIFEAPYNGKTLSLREATDCYFKV
ncbi:hypothetical protein VNO78_06587 [Psophocarpus tetragonolobus]|uniref:GH18 domain-containing protein n=1 Tax=Psophocarpus tetragonolobus TaxID=3891 RepID=A0AAN9SSG4_PSOTE